MKIFILILGLIIFSFLPAFSQARKDSVKPKIIKFQYIPGYNKKIVAGIITATFKSTRWNKEFIWYKIGDILVHVWPKDLDTTMHIGKYYEFKGTKRLDTNIDKVIID